MSERIGQKVKLTSYSDLLGLGNEESAVDVEINQIHSFENHPFKVQDDERMQDLVESIKANGVLTPVLLRPSSKTRGYEMISGHRRMHAAQQVGLTVIPAMIREMDDDSAVLAMVDANIQREELLPSEKAFAFKMKLDAIKHQGERLDLTCAQNEHKTVGVKSRDIVAKEAGVSKNQISRYIRLTELLPDLLDMVDRKRLQFTAAVEISYLDKPTQQWIYEYINENGNVKQNHITLLRQELAKGPMTQGQMIYFLNHNIAGRIPKKKVTLTDKKLNQYFPKHYTTTQMEKVIIKLLKEWKEHGGDADEI